MDSNSNSNETRLKAAGLRMALKVIPKDMLDQAPSTLEKYILNKLSEVDQERHETEACYLLAQDKTDGALRIMLVTLDENCAVDRVVSKMTVSELFSQILAELQNI